MKLKEWMPPFPKWQGLRGQAKVAQPNYWWLWICIPLAAIAIVLTAIPAAVGFAWDLMTGRDPLGKAAEEIGKDWNDSGNPRFPRG